MGLFKAIMNRGRVGELIEEWKQQNIPYFDREKEIRKKLEHIDIEISEQNGIRTPREVQRLRRELGVRYTHLSGIVGLGSTPHFTNNEELDRFHDDLQTQLSWFESWQSKMKNIQDQIAQLQK